MVYSNSSTLPANVDMANGLSEVLQGDFTLARKLYTEYRAVEQFPGEEYDRFFNEMLGRKYRARQIDGIIALGPAAAKLVIENRSDFAPDAPIVIGGVNHKAFAEDIPSDVHAAISSFDVNETLEFAKRMQPDARRLVVFTGSSEFDMNWERTARKEFADEQSLEVEYVTGLTLSEFEAVAAGLEPDTILLILSIFEDADGVHFNPADSTKRVTAQSGAPSWGMYSTFLDNGVVGGVVADFEEIGRIVGEMTMNAIAGELEPRTTVPLRNNNMVDWRELSRFDLDPEQLPKDTVILNHSPSAWDRYWHFILLGLGVALIQSATIVALIIQGRRRHKAQQEATEHRLELARLSRVSQLGVLSGAITHELNQPLTAILANAEAGTRLIRKSPPDIAEVETVLKEVTDDGRRAASIISNLRSLMSRKVAEPKRLDLNDVAKVVAGLVKSEALIRRVQLVLKTSPEPLFVMGQSEQFKQIVLNLVLNGMDAMAGQPVSSRRLSIETFERADGWRVIAVQDAGPGMPEKVANNLFKPFITTKRNGMGLGLAICNSIAEVYHGKISFEFREQGMRAMFSMPPEDSK